MTKIFKRRLTLGILLSLALLIVIGIVFLTLPDSPQRSSVTTAGNTPADDFNRSNGSLGKNWMGIPDGKMAISSHAATGTSASGISGNIWAAKELPSNQYSQVEVASTQLTGNQWIGSAVRVQRGGQDAYLGTYWWNQGRPQLKLYLRHAGNFTPIGGAYNSGPLAAGTRLKLMAIGNTIALMENGVQRIAVANGTLTRGAPGIMAYGAAKGDNWSGGDAGGFQVSYRGTDALGIKSYNIISDSNGYGPQILRVLPPKDPTPGVAHNFLVVLRVGPGQGTRYGDGLQTMRALGAQDRYNLTIVESTFAFDPWYADNPHYPHFRYETFMTQELEPWIKQNLATTGHEQTWLIGFSKSGIAGQDLILKHPDLFSLAASWDFPAGMSSYDQYGAASSYGTDANFRANYRLTPAFLNAHKGPFVSSNRIWIGGYAIFRKDISDYSALLTSAGITHITGTPQRMAHSWNSGWVPIALAALHQESIHLKAG